MPSPKAVLALSVALCNCCTVVGRSTLHASLAAPGRLKSRTYVYRRCIGPKGSSRSSAKGSGGRRGSKGRSGGRGAKRRGGWRGAPKVGAPPKPGAAAGAPPPKLNIGGAPRLGWLPLRLSRALGVQERCTLEKTQGGRNRNHVPHRGRTLRHLSHVLVHLIVVSHSNISSSPDATLRAWRSIGSRKTARVTPPA